MREYISPNWHAVLIHAPLGLLSIGILIEVFSFLWRRSSARAAGRWMILLGALTSVPALTTGMYAFRDAVDPHTKAGEITFDTAWAETLEQPWTNRTSGSRGNEIKEINVRQFLDSDAGHALWHHLLYNCIGVGTIFLAILTFIGCSDLWRRRLYLPLLLILLCGKGMLIRGSHQAGIAVYEHAVAIKPATPPSTIAPTMNERAQAILPAAQLHVMLAGCMVGLSLLALALSIRAMTEGVPAQADDSWYPGRPPHDTDHPNPDNSLGDPSWYQSAPPPVSSIDVAAPVIDGIDGGKPVASTQVTVAHEPDARRSTIVTIRGAAELAAPISAARFWVLAAFFGLVTAVAGLWIINTWSWKAIQDTLRGEVRNKYHTILGISLIVLTLVLALVTRFARRNKILLSAFSLLLFVVVGLQMWVGIVLMFDGAKPKGMQHGLIGPLKFVAAEKD